MRTIAKISSSWTLLSLTALLFTILFLYVIQSEFPSLAAVIRDLPIAVPAFILFATLRIICLPTNETLVETLVQEQKDVEGDWSPSTVSLWWRVTHMTVRQKALLLMMIIPIVAISTLLLIGRQGISILTSLPSGIVLPIFVVYCSSVLILVAIEICNLLIMSGKIGKK